MSSAITSLDRICLVPLAKLVLQERWLTRSSSFSMSASTITFGLVSLAQVVVMVWVASAVAVIANLMIFSYRLSGTPSSIGVNGISSVSSADCDMLVDFIWVRVVCEKFAGLEKSLTVTWGDFQQVPDAHKSLPRLASK
jgi:hypothetical protein